MSKTDLFDLSAANQQARHHLEKKSRSTAMRVAGFRLDRDMLATFKSLCASEGVTMTSVVRDSISDWITDHQTSSNL